MLATKYDGNNLWSPGADVFSGVNWWDWSGPGLTPDGSRNGAVYQAPAVSGATITVNANNRNGAVAMYGTVGIFAMADTSAKALAPVATNPNPGTLPLQNKWNAFR
jgi:hypothetical protein